MILSDRLAIIPTERLYSLVPIKYRSTHDIAPSTALGNLRAKKLFSSKIEMGPPNRRENKNGPKLGPQLSYPQIP